MTDTQLAELQLLRGRIVEVQALQVICQNFCISLLTSFMPVLIAYLWKQARARLGEAGLSAGANMHDERLHL